MALFRLMGLAREGSNPFDSTNHYNLNTRHGRRNSETDTEGC